MNNVRLFAGSRNRNGSFPIYISFSGQDTAYLLTQRSNRKIYDALKPGVTVRQFEQLYRHNRRGRRSCIFKNSMKHILSVANDYIKYEYPAEKGGENHEEDFSNYRPALCCGQI